MGYSLNFPKRASKKRTRILKVLKKEFKPFDVLFDNVTEEEGIAARLSDNVTYGGGAGFDYSSWISSRERHYIWAVVEEVAIAMCKKKPYFMYDGNEKMIVKPHKRMWDFVSEIGPRRIDWLSRQKIQSECERLRKCFEDKK